MPFAAALSTYADTRQALTEATDQAASALGGAPDLALIFFSPHHEDSAAEIVALAREPRAALPAGVQCRIDRRQRPGDRTGAGSELVAGSVAKPGAIHSFSPQSGIDARWS